MSFLFYPDEYLESFLDIDIGELKKKGIKAIISDIDDTLEPYEEPLPTEKTREWIEMIKENGIQLGFLSNNKEGRAKLFASETGCPYMYLSHKPLTKNAKELMRIMGSDSKTTVMLGDQILTDVLCGKRCGMYCIMVKPLAKRTTFTFRLKRSIEKPIMYFYFKRKNKNVK